MSNAGTFPRQNPCKKVIEKKGLLALKTHTQSQTEKGGKSGWFQYLYAFFSKNILGCLKHTSVF